MIVLKDYWATWCPPCKQMNPIIEEIEAELPDVKVEKIDIDNNPEVAQADGVMSIPTYVVLNDGKEVARIVGATSKSNLLQAIKQG